jgi:hypothetical protein
MQFSMNADQMTSAFQCAGKFVNFLLKELLHFEVFLVDQRALLAVQEVVFQDAIAMKAFHYLPALIFAFHLQSAK